MIVKIRSSSPANDEPDAIHRSARVYLCTAPFRVPDPLSLKLEYGGTYALSHSGYPIH